MIVSDTKKTGERTQTGRQNTAAAPTASVTAAATAAPVPEDPAVRLQRSCRLLGRCLSDSRSDAVWFSFTGAGFALDFTGCRLEARLTADIESVRDADRRPWLCIYLDDEETPAQTVCIDRREMTVTLFSADRPRHVRIRVVKRSEASASSFGLRELVCDSGGTMRPTQPSARRILFLGDSFTCGYGNEGAPGEPFSTATENGCETFAARTARALAADAQMVCWSGIGVYSSYTTTAEPNRTLCMADLYVRQDYGGCRRLILPQQAADPAGFSPQAIVIDLGTNDASYTARAGDAGRRQFIAAYAALLDTLRRDAPQAWIFCTLGPLTEESGRLFALIRELTDARRAAGDTRICALSFPAATAEEGLGTDDHPSRKTHGRMALALTEEIRTRLCW